MTPAAALALLQQWRAAGWLRPLDLAFARFVHGLDPQAPGSLLLAAGLLAQLEGQGHSCLPIDALARDPLDLLAWPTAAAGALSGALFDWPADAPAARAAWGGRAVLQIEPTDETGASPLVLSGHRLCLRRYWRHESHVAAHVGARTRAGQDAAGAMSSARRERASALLDRLFPEATPSSPSLLLSSPSLPSEAMLDESDAIDRQKIACALALRRRLTLVTGGPGTGKTYTAARLLVLMRALHEGPLPLRVALAAPTGKAAARLRQSIEAALHGMRERLGEPLPSDPWETPLPPARTLHALLGARPGTRRFAHGAARPLDVDLLLVDEASMVDLETMAALLEALPPDATLVLLGDKDQLASVEAGAVMGALCRPSGRDAAGADDGYRPDTVRWVAGLTGQALPSSASGAGTDLAQQTITLHRSRRFDGPIGQLAAAVNRGDGATAMALLRADAGGEVASIDVRDASAVPAIAVDGRAGALGGYRDCLGSPASRPAEADTQADAFEAWALDVLGRFDRFRVLCAVREGPWGVARLNASIESALRDAGLIQPQGEWYEGRPVMVTRNDASLGVFNGDVGLVLRPPGDGPGQSRALRAYFLDGSGLRSVAVGRLADVETAFATTVHKAQGSEFDHVVLVLPPDDSRVLTRELVYTGITRARRAFTLVASEASQLAAASARPTRRASGLSALLDAASAP